MKITPSQIIDKLGGTSEVAALCEISDAAVSQWRTNGIPKSQLKFLKAVRPRKFKELEREDSRGGANANTR